MQQVRFECKNDSWVPVSPVGLARGFGELDDFTLGNRQRF